MIDVSIKFTDNLISEMLIEGHAGADIKGKDLVCAGVSSIMVGTLNALDLKNVDCNMDMENGYIKIIMHNLNDQVGQIILYTCMIQLETMKESYSKYIRIRKQEV